MKNAFFGIGMLLLISGAYTHAQIVISGKVVDQSGKPLPAVNITAGEVHSSRIYAFAVTKENGSFQLKITQDDDSLLLRVSRINFAKQALIVPNQTQALDFRLSEEVLELREVKVKSPPAKRMGDTLHYNVEAFRSSSDRTIGDVIRRLPGVEVAPSGEIRYQGKSINAYYVEGLNLMGGQYGILNENLQARTAVSIEILANHQPLRVLDSLQVPERAAINIRLKKQVTASAGFHYGLGARPLLWDINLTPMVFTPRFQALGSYQGNNAGINIRNQLTDHFNEATLQRWLSIPAMTTPPFSSERWLDNLSHVGSLNLLKKGATGIEFKLNSSLIIDAQKQAGNASTAYTPGTEPIRYTENISHYFKFNEINVTLSAIKNTARRFFKSDLSLTKEWESGKGNHQRINREYRQRSTSDQWKITHNFHTVFLVRKAILNLYSNTSWAENEQDLQVNFNGVDSSASPYQVLSRRVFQTRNYVEFNKKRKELVFTVQAGHRLALNHILTDLQAHPLFSPAYGNFHWNTSATYFSTRTSLRSRDKKWFSLLEVPLTHYHITYRMPGERRGLSRVIPEPRIFIRRDFSKAFNVYSSLHFQNALAQLGSIFPEYVMTTYLTTIKQDAGFKRTQQLHANAGFIYTEVESLFTLNLNYSYRLSRSNQMENTAIAPDGSLEIHPEALTGVSTSGFLSGRISKNFFSIRTTPVLGFLLTKNHTDRRINQNSGRFSYRTFSPYFSLNFNRIRAVQLEYNVNYLGMKNSGSPVSQVNQLLKLYVYPARNLMLKTVYEHYQNDWNAHRRNQGFVDLLLRVSLPKVRQDIEIQLSNLLDTRNFRTLQVYEYYTMESIFNLRPRQVMLRGRLTF